MITIYDIAEKCGCDAATVSRALNHKGNVKKETMKKIIKAAKELDYVPNHTAKNLKTNRSHDIGVLLNVGYDIGLKHYLFADILDNFARGVQQQGYEVVLLTTHYEYIEKDYLKYCKSKMLDGVFIICGDFNNKSIKDLMASEIPIVAVDYLSNGEQNVNCITSDNCNIMYALTDKVISYGHKNIVFISGMKEAYVTNERVKGFKKALNKNGIEYKDDMIVQGEYYGRESTNKVIKQIMERTNKPSLIMLPDDYCAVSAVKYLQQMGYRVPEDISVTGFDGLEIAELITPSIMTVKQDTVTIGNLAAKRMLDLINKKDIEDNYLEVVKASIVEGNSVKKLN